MNKNVQAVPVTVPTRKRGKRTFPRYLPFALAGLLLFACLVWTLGQGGETPVNQVSAAGSPGHAIQSDAGYQQDDSAWRLTLVNPWHFLPADYAVTLAQLPDGHAVDARCYPDLKQMLDDCEAAGLSPVICSSYRTQEKQETLYRNQVKRYLSQGYSAEGAKVEAAKSVAVPGSSEHQLGLAVDIVDWRNQNLDQSQENTPVQKWLMDHSWQYGFILRYPNEKSEITGIIYEPWHYRYVGQDAAKQIHEQDLCLEEYLAQLQG